MYIFYNGIYYARVTSLLSDYQNFSHIDPAVLQKKAEIGTQTHENINHFLTYEMHPPDRTEYYPAFLQFNKEKKFLENNIISTEERIFSKNYLVSGAVDCVIDFQNEEIALIDWKTSSNFYEDYMSLQTCIYKILYDSNNFLTIDNCYVVLLKNYASYSIHKIDLKKYVPIAYEILEEHINAL